MALPLNITGAWNPLDAFLSYSNFISSHSVARISLYPSVACHFNFRPPCLLPQCAGTKLLQTRLLLAKPSKLLAQPQDISEQIVDW